MSSCGRPDAVRCAMMVVVDDRGLLELIYRSRPSTVASLAAFSHLDEAEVSARVARLEELGALSVREGVITYPHPASWTAKVVEAQTRAVRESSASATAQIEALVAELPSMLRHWSVGEASGDLAPVFARHGPHAAEDLWYDTSLESTRHRVGGAAERRAVSEERPGASGPLRRGFRPQAVGAGSPAQIRARRRAARGDGSGLRGVRRRVPRARRPAELVLDRR